MREHLTYKLVTKQQHYKSLIEYINRHTVIQHMSYIYNFQITNSQIELLA